MTINKKSVNSSKLAASIVSSLGPGATVSFIRNYTPRETLGFFNLKPGKHISRFYPLVMYER